MVGFNEDYPNFNNVPVYAFSGHGSIFPKRNDCDFINDSVVFWISEELDLRNCSPFSIKVRKGFWSYENTKGGEFDGFHPKCKANFHHFCYEHSNLIGDGMSCLLINTIIPLMQGKSPKKCNTCDSNGNASQNAPASESANFPVFNELFYLGSNSSKTIQVNISSTDTATFTAFSEGMDIELSLTDPGGQKITSTNYSSNTSIKYSKTHWGIQYSIANPKAGAWKVKVTAKNCNDYVAVGVYEKTTWTILGASNKTNYYPNSQAILNAKIDGTSGGVNITTFQATTYDENQVEISTINLYDDGKHNDQSAGDGIFGNAYNTPNQEGYYRLKFHAESSAKEQRESSGGYTVTGSLPSSEITLSRSNMYFGAAGQSFTSTQNVLISNKGSGILNWSASSNVSWLNFSPSSGIGASVFSVSANPSGLAAGIYTGTITITDPNASNSPQSISVRLQVYNPGTTAVPFGEFATPAEGSQAYGSVPVTGWALDDVEVANVKIYNGDLYIGEALLVEGARPDVEQTHPEHPMNYRAGWGYMMLTNFLPNNGNGTFKIHAVATDLEGHQVTLGTKTIICDNANAVKPFGSIDTPTQGGTASGNNFINWGWVLTPQPNKIPTDGSTINVYVDGVNLGHPTYNIYRSDIAQLFPGYNNSDGAAGFLSFDTTSYTNGVHTMQWTATDNGGNSDGIGSRYFTIQNTGNSQSKAQTTSSGKIVTGQKFFHLSQIVDIPLNDSESIRVKRGLKDNIEPELVSADESGDFIIKIKELERLVIEFSKKSALIEGYTIVRDELRPLPIGSIIDFKEKKFYWQPGPGFVGYYRFVFIERSEDNQINRKHIIVKIETKSMK
jgi:flagellar hook assembly protein FlgD